MGVKLPARVGSPGEFLADARAYEAAGVDSLWLSDGMFRPAGPAARIPPGLDAWTLLAALAAATSGVRLGTSVTVLAQWPPALLAQIVTTLDHLSQGRLLVGAGAGWERVQLEANQVGFGDRGRRLDETIEVMRALWSGSRQPYRGRFFELPALHVAAPYRPGGPPVLVGGLGEPGLRRAARLGDGFIAAGGAPDQVAAQFERVRALRSEAGREGEFQLWSQAGSPGGRRQWRETLEAFSRAGATGLIVDHAPNLLDILRNPDEDDRQDLQMSVG